MVEFKSTENGVAIIVTLLLSPDEGIHEIIKKHSKALAPRIQNIAKDFPEIDCVDGGNQNGKEYFRAVFVPKDIAIKSYRELRNIVDGHVASTHSVYQAIYDEIQSFLKGLETEDEADTTESDDATDQAAETRKFESLGEFLQEMFKDIISMEKGDKITFTIELS